MSDILTRISLPNLKCSGILRRGRLSAPEIIAQFREYVRFEKEQADEAYEAVLSAPDEAFQIDIVKGSIVERLVKELQRSSINENKTHT